MTGWQTTAVAVALGLVVGALVAAEARPRPICPPTPAPPGIWL